MRSRIALLVSSLLQCGCASLINSNRPAYHGRILPPAWHNTSVQVEQTPVIVDGIVYAVARSFTQSDSPRVYAFDLETGKELWHTAYSAENILAAAHSALVVSDSEHLMHVLDPATGREIVVPASTPFVGATVSGSRLYTIRPNTVEAHSLPTLTAQQRAAIPFQNALAPVVAGGRVYVLGALPWNSRDKTGGFTALYAFEEQTLTLAWKWELPDKVGAISPVALAADDAAAYLWLRQTGRDSFSKGLLITLDAASGNEKWRHAAEGYPPFSRAALLEPDLIVIPDNPPGSEANSDSSGYLFRALHRANGSMAWESRTSWKYQVVNFSGNLLLISDRKVHQVLNENNESSPDSWVSVLDLRTGKELWRSPVMELAVLTTPAASATMMVVGSKPYRHNDVRGKNDVAGLWAWRLSQ